MVRGKVALLGWYSCWFYILLCACLILIYASLYFLLCRNLFNFIGNLFTENVNGTWRGCNIFPFPSFKCIMMQCQYGWIEQPKSLFLFVWEKPWYTVYKWYTKSGRTYKKHGSPQWVPGIQKVVESTKKHGSPQWAPYHQYSMASRVYPKID